MYYAIDVDVLRRDFPLDEKSDEQDLLLVPRLFAYLDKASKDKSIPTTKGTDGAVKIKRHELRRTISSPRFVKNYPPLFAEIVFAVDKQLSANKRLMPSSTRLGVVQKCVHLRQWVRECYESGTLPLNQWGYINRREMSRQIGISYLEKAWPKQIYRHMQRIGRLMERLPEHPNNSPFYVTVDKHVKTYDISFVTALDRVLAAEVAQCFKIRVETLGKSTATSQLAYIREFFGFWIDQTASGDKRFTVIGKALANGEKPSSEDIEFVLRSFQSSVCEKAGKRNTCVAQFSAINKFFEVLSRQGVLPQSYELRVPASSKSQSLVAGSRPKLSLAEVPTKRFPEEEVEDLIRPLLEKRFSKDEVVELTRKDFLKTLASEGYAVSKSRREHLKFIEEINERRLRDLRKAAEDELLDCWFEYERGQKILEGCDLSYEKDIVQLIQEHLSLPYKQGWGKNRLWRELFAGVDTEVRIARYLRILESRYNGIFPAIDYRTLEMCSFHVRGTAELGGRRAIRAMLEPRAEAYVAAILILLIDTGANVSVITNLPYNCLKDRDDSNEKSFTGWKKRANNKVIRDVLLIDDGNRVSSVRAIEMMKEMTSRFRRLAEHGPGGPYWHKSYEVMPVPDETDPLHKFLFLSKFKPKEPVRLLENSVIQVNFKKFLKKHHDFRYLDSIRMDGIRSSVLLAEAFKGNGGLLVAQALADQNSRDTTNGYIHKYAQAVILETSIRKFQDLLEAVLIADVPNGHEKLGIPEEEYFEALSEAHRTGLGVMCLKPMDGFQPGTDKGSACDKLERCPACEKMFVPATLQNVQDMILFNRYLNEKQEELEALSPHDWENIWLPYRVLTDEALARIQKGETATVYQQAMKQVGDAKFSCEQLVA